MQIDVSSDAAFTFMQMNEIYLVIEIRFIWKGLSILWFKCSMLMDCLIVG